MKQGLLKKRIISCSILLFCIAFILALFSSCSTTEEISVPTPEQDKFVYDKANLIDDSLEASINNYLIDLEDKSTIEFAVITTETLQNYSIEYYANTVFNELGIGKADKDNGILLLIAPTEERVRLEIGRGLEGVFTDSKCGQILDDYFVPHRTEGDYNTATDLTVKAIITILMQEYGFEIEGINADEITAISSDTTELNIIVAILIIVILIIVVSMIILFVDGNSSDDFFSGGGFSSGGGGGFGGGFSGGGGASR